MKPLRVLICGGNHQPLQKVAKALSDEGMKVETSTRVIDCLCIPNQKWDFLLVDLDGLDSFLRGLLPAVRIKYPELHIVGISTRSTTDISFLPSDLVLDGYFPSMPRPEDLIVGFPRVTANYLCDTNALRAVTATH